VTRIRKLMPEELQRRNYSSETIRTYINAVKQYADYFRQSPDKLGPEHIRQYQLHLVERKLATHTVRVQSSALRFLYIHTLRRPYMLEHIPTPQTPVKLPSILSGEEVAQLIEGASEPDVQGDHHDSVLDGHAALGGMPASGQRHCQRPQCDSHPRRLAPHDLAVLAHRLCHLAGGELDQIQFLPGHVFDPNHRALPRMQAEVPRDCQ
jgi:hypothetical protein